MVSTSTKVALLVVTYAERSALLIQALRAARPVVTSMVVVLNGRTDVDCELLRTEFDRLTIIELEENAGSAGGIAAGLEHLRCGDFSHVLILDDDNVVTSSDWPRVEEFLRENPRAGISFLRQDRLWQREVLRRGADRSELIVRRSCLGFDLRDYLRPMKDGGDSSRKFVEIRWAPWGGLLLPLECLAVVGAPDTEWFAYFDDCEFTLRVTSHGYGIYVSDAMCIEDVDASWHNAKMVGTRWVDRLLSNGEDWRVGLAVRNQAYFDTFTYPRQGAMYLLNCLILAARIGLRAMALRRWRRATNLVRWYAQGLRGMRGALE